MIIESSTNAFVPRDNGDLVIPTQMRYDTDRPAEVTFVFQNQDQEVEWSFARSLLHEGTQRTAGEGDVMFTPSTREGLILGRLESPFGELDFTMSEMDLLDFLNKTYEKVPVDQEERVISEAFDDWFSGEFEVE